MFFRVGFKLWVFPDFPSALPHMFCIEYCIILPSLPPCFCSILFITNWRLFTIFPQGHHWSCQTSTLLTLPNQFANSKTNIVFNQMQLGLQVKISFQLKLIRAIMSLGESWVTTACMGSPLVTNNSTSQWWWLMLNVSYRVAEEQKFVLKGISIAQMEQLSFFNITVHNEPWAKRP